ALQMTNDRMVRRILSIYVGIGELFLQTGQQTRGIELILLALHHSVSDQDTKDRAQRLLTSYPEAAALEQPIVTNVNFDAITNALLAEFQVSENRVATRQTPEIGETLTEPLSARELEILTLIAAGSSNRQIAEQLFLTIGTVKW